MARGYKYNRWWKTTRFAHKEPHVKLLVVGQRTGVTEELHDFITRRLHFALGRFAPEVERVTARIGDVNGPRGGMDKRCRLEVKLRGLGNVLGEACADDFEAAVAFAAERLERGVARALQRRHHTKRRPGASMAGPREAAENGKRPYEKKRASPAVEPEGT
jgi:ribosome-associated translation inhibitor RaiA